MADVAIITHPRNRKYRDAMLQAAARFARRMDLPNIDVGFDKTLPERRVVNGRDDGPLFVVQTGDGRRESIKLVVGRAKAGVK